MSVKIDYSKDSLLDEFAIATLKDRYMIPGEESPQEAFARAAETFADDDDHAQRLYDYVSQLWFMFATPVLSNGGTRRGLPISCFLNYVDDSREGITDHFTENAFLSSFGGGIGGHWSDVRSVGSNTSKGSESIIATLTEIAQSSKDPQVAMEALRQLSEIRKADVDAAKDAYIDD